MIQDVSETREPYFIIVMEELKPLPPEIVKAWQGESKMKQEFDVNIWQAYNKDTLGRLLKEKDPSERYDLPSAQELIKRLNEVHYSAAYGGGKIHKDPLNEPPAAPYITQQILNHLDPHNGGEEGTWLSWKAMTIIIKYMYGLEKNTDSGYDFFPRKSSHDDGKVISPEFTGIYNALKVLKSEGIMWNDLHAGNVMIGVDDGEIKIVDVGLFNDTTEQQTEKDLNAPKPAPKAVPINPNPLQGSTHKPEPAARHKVPERIEASPDVSFESDDPRDSDDWR